MTDARVIFGMKVREIRYRKHLKQESLAMKAGISQSLISRIETGNLSYDPSKDLIERLARALEVNPKILVKGSPFSSLFSTRDSSDIVSEVLLSRRLDSVRPIPVSHRIAPGLVRLKEEYQIKETLTGRTHTRKAKDPFRISGTLLNGKYELTEFAGAGGMGAVYRATNLTTGETVAVKILQPHIVARSPECAELFEREAKHAQSLDHPHIVKIFDSGKDEDLSYMVMEWVDGRSIEDILTQGHLPLERLRNIFEQICSAVAFAHKRNIIHLDLKPGNILLLYNSQSDSFVKVIDFGLSRVISKESGTTVTKFRGTHQFCAPEQFGGKVSHRSDIYSLGATLYYLITGVVPFGASYINAKIHPNLELPEIPSVTRQRAVPTEVDFVIRKALNREPNLRQRSALQLFEEFSAALRKALSVPDRKAGAKKSKRNLSSSAQAKSIAADILVGAGIGALIGAIESEKNPRPLSTREREVLQLIAEGYSSSEIAARLGVAKTTIKTHRNRIMEKLEIHDTAGLTRHAISIGLIRAS